MPKSLKSILIENIRKFRKLRYEEAVKIAVEEGFRVSNMERRMREIIAESECIRPEYAKSKRGTTYIKGYTYIQPAPRIPVQTKLI